MQDQNGQLPTRQRIILVPLWDFKIRLIGLCDLYDLILVVEAKYRGQLPALSSSTNVTRLISCKVEIPVKTFCKADSRKLVNPSASAARRTSEPGRRSTIISRILSDKSSNS